MPTMRDKFADKQTMSAFIRGEVSSTSDQPDPSHLSVQTVFACLVIGIVIAALATIAALSFEVPPCCSGLSQHERFRSR